MLQKTNTPCFAVLPPISPGNPVVCCFLHNTKPCPLTFEPGKELKIFLHNVDRADNNWHFWRCLKKLSHYFLPAFVPKSFWEHVCVSHALHSAHWVTQEVTHFGGGGGNTKTNTVDLLSSWIPHGGLQICLSMNVHILEAPPVTAQCWDTESVTKTHNAHSSHPLWVSDRKFFTL